MAGHYTSPGEAAVCTASRPLSDFMGQRPLVTLASLLGRENVGQKPHSEQISALLQPLVKRSVH